MAPSTRSAFVCANCARALSRPHKTSTGALRTFSVSSSSRESLDTDAATSTHLAEDLPRWKQTPASMRMPYRLRPLPNQPAWVVNDEQAPLDEMYDRFLMGIEGNKAGRTLLDDETKWLAVTHKSFDHGRQGANDRLAYLGKRIVDLETSVALLSAPTATSLTGKTLPTRQTYPGFRHPALQGLENVTTSIKSQVLSPMRLALVASAAGIESVARWKPRQTERLKASGMETILAHTVYSIVGAIALKRGGEVAAKLVREKILAPLGLK